MTHPESSQAIGKETPTGIQWSRLLGVLFLALIVRAYLCSQPACISRDGVQFVTFARQLAEDPIRWMRIHTKQPGFSFVLLATHRVFGPVFGGDTPEAWQRCGEIPALLGGVAVCGLIYILTRRLFKDDRIAAAAGLLACFWPQGAHLSADALSDMPHLALYLAALLLATGVLTKPRIWKLAFCGTVTGMAYLLRQEALGHLAAVALALLWLRPFKTWGQNLSGIIVLLIGFVVAVAPYSIACGQIMPNKGPQDLIERLGAAPEPCSLLLAKIPSWQIPGNLAEAWAKSGRYVFSTLFVLALLIKTVPRAEPKGKQFVLIAVLIHVLLVLLRVSVFGETSTRYMVIPVVLCLPWAAAALTTIFSALATRSAHSEMKLRMVCLCGWIVTLALPLYYVSLPVNAGKEPYRVAGIWLRQHADPDDFALAHDRLEQFMFYAGRTYPHQDKWLKYKETDSVELIRKRLRRHKPDWVVDATASRRQPVNESRFFSALSSVPELTPMYSTTPSERRVHIFRTTPRTLVPTGVPTSNSVPSIR